MKQLDLTEILSKVRTLDCQEMMNYFNAHGAKFWSWGARGFTNIQNKCLRFRVSGHHHKGFVYVVCNGADLMDFYLTNLKGEIKLEMTDLYIEDLFRIMDEKIEKIAAYKE